MMKKSDQGRVKNGVRSVVTAKPRDRLSSAFFPGTTPMIIGANGEPTWRMVKPATPNQNSVHRSNCTLLSENTPIAV